MRVHHPLAPRRLGPPNGDSAHAGTITTTRPDELWGTDATRFYTEADGWCWFFGAIIPLACPKNRERYSRLQPIAELTRASQAPHDCGVGSGDGG